MNFALLELHNFMFVNVVIFDVNVIDTTYIDNLNKTVPYNSSYGDVIVFFLSRFWLIGLCLLRLIALSKGSICRCVQEDNLTWMLDMPLCSGPPSGPCPRKVNDSLVSFCIADEFQCPACLLVRFPPSNNRACFRISAKSNISIMDISHAKGQ